jgi:hypothetical protein
MSEHTERIITGTAMVMLILFILGVGCYEEGKKAADRWHAAHPVVKLVEKRVEVPARFTLSDVAKTKEMENCHLPKCVVITDITVGGFTSENLTMDMSWDGTEPNCEKKQP